MQDLQLAVGERERVVPRHPRPSGGERDAPGDRPLPDPSGGRGRQNLLGTTSPLGGSEQHGKGHPERSYELDERTRDADADLLLHFRPADSLLTPDTTQACLKGRYAAPDGNEYTFFGCDSVEVITSP